MLGGVPLLANEAIMPGIHLLWLEAPEVAAAAQPGQFLMLRWGAGEFSLRRPLAIHRVEGNRVALLVRASGRGTRWLCARRSGERLDILGPLGKGFEVAPTSRRLLLLAGGMGIAPLLFLAQQELGAGRRVALLMGARSASVLYPLSLLPQGVEVLRSTDDGTAGVKGTVTDLLQAISPPFDQAFAAGPLSLYEKLSRSGFPSLAGVPLQVSVETRMGCGFGACLGCAIPTSQGLKLVCRDGPVFDLNQVQLNGIRL